MKLELFILLVTGIALFGLSTTSAAAEDRTVVQRDLSDAFVDTLFLEDVDPIRAQMPTNWGDPVTSLVAATRVDNFNAIVAGLPYATLEEMLLAFYNNQLAFNNDPSRNRIQMHGTVKEVIEEDGTVVAIANIAYTDIPLSLYDLNNWNQALFEELDPTQLVQILEDGFLDGRFYVEMEIPSPGAPLHFWNSLLNGGVRKSTFVGNGEGWLVDENGERTGRATVFIQQDEERSIVRFTPIN